MHSTSLGLYRILTIQFVVDGREIAPLNEAQIIEQCSQIKAKGLNNVRFHGATFLDRLVDRRISHSGGFEWYLFPT